MDLSGLCRDLSAEQAELDGIVSELDHAGWDTPTPAEGWSVRDQISHLAFFDDAAATAASRPDEFTAGLAGIAEDLAGFIDGPIDRGRTMDPGGVLSWWRVARAASLQAFEDLDPSRRVPWYGPPMSPASFISARIMETWAHGQDVVDGLGFSRAPTDRLRHVAHVGVRARPYSYTVNARPLPDERVAVVLTSPAGESWSWDEGASARVTGSALDFCLLVTQRRHLDDTGIRAEGDAAHEWLSIAQCFAGPPGSGRAPGQFSKAGT